MRLWPALALLLAAAPAGAQTAGQRQTASLLGLLLSPAARPATGPAGEDCALSPGAATLTQDLLLTLALLGADGRIASRCEPAGAATRCDVSIGQTPHSDALWARSYRITTNAAHTSLDGPVICFTIP
jgi:hypothetical protein